MNRSKKYKTVSIKTVWRGILSENIIFFIGMIVGLIFILFSSNVKDHDATYYISLSSNFRNGIFSPDGIEVTPVQYRAPAMYYTYAVFFQNSIVESYYLLNPIIYLCMAIDLAKQASRVFNIQSKKIMYVVEFFVVMGITLISASSLGFLIGMNILPISIILVYILLVFYNKNVKIDIACFSLIGVSFFSSTGTLIVLPLSLAIFIYFFLAKGMKYSTRCLYLPIVTVIYYVFSFIDHGQSLAALSILLITIFIPIVWSIISIKLINKRQDKIILLNKLESKQYYVWVSSIIFLLIGVFVFVYWTFIYESNYYFSELGYLSLFFSVFLIGFNIYYFKKDSQNLNTSIILLIFLIGLISTLESAIINAIPALSSNQSIWRLNFLVLGFNSVNDIVIIIVFLIAWLVNVLKQSKFKTSKLIDWFSIIISLLVSTAGAVNLGQAHHVIFKNAGNTDSTAYLSFGNNAQVNLYKLTYSDINMLSNLIKNFDTTYVTDGPYASYLNMGIDVSRYITFFKDKDNKMLSNHAWNYNNFNFGINDWNKLYPNELITLDDFPLLFEDLITRFSELNLKSLKSNKKLDKLNYIILQNDTSYFNDFKAFLTAWTPQPWKTTIGDNITIFTNPINYE